MELVEIDPKFSSNSAFHLKDLKTGYLVSLYFYFLICQLGKKITFIFLFGGNEAELIKLNFNLKVFRLPFKHSA